MPGSSSQRQSSSPAAREGLFMPGSSLQPNSPAARAGVLMPGSSSQQQPNSPATTAGMLISGSSSQQQPESPAATAGMLIPGSSSQQQPNSLAARSSLLMPGSNQQPDSVAARGNTAQPAQQLRDTAHVPGLYNTGSNAYAGASESSQQAVSLAGKTPAGLQSNAYAGLSLGAGQGERPRSGASPKAGAVLIPNGFPAGQSGHHMGQYTGAGQFAGAGQSLGAGLNSSQAHAQPQSSGNSEQPTQPNSGSQQLSAVGSVQHPTSTGLAAPVQLPKAQEAADSAAAGTVSATQQAASSQAAVGDASVKAAQESAQQQADTQKAAKAHSNGNVHTGSDTRPPMDDANDTDLLADVPQLI